MGVQGAKEGPDGDKLSLTDPVAKYEVRGQYLTPDAVQSTTNSPAEAWTFGRCCTCVAAVELHSQHLQPS
ncbi:hypothetical protein GCM10010372_80320 [Streptomyces tauricus]|nr:hypothetical protein GCM10010372_80320 [Streptomyces tauricus]